MKPKGTKTSKTTRKRQTNDAKKIFKEWEKEPTNYIPKKSEFFIPVATTTGMGRYYVSNKGVILSACRGSVTPLADTGNKNYNQVYVPNTKFGTSNVQRVVWFSFYYAQKNPKTHNHKKAVKIELKSYGLGKIINPSNIEIHHINGNEKDNRIENLIALPKSVHKDLLNYLQKLPNALERKEKQETEIIQRIGKAHEFEPNQILVVLDNPKETSIQTLDNYDEVADIIAETFGATRIKDKKALRPYIYRLLTNFYKDSLENLFVQQTKYIVNEIYSTYGAKPFKNNFTMQILEDTQEPQCIKCAEYQADTHNVVQLNDILIIEPDITVIASKGEINIKDTSKFI